MLRFKVKEAIAKKEFAERRRITIGEVAETTGIHLGKLCHYFGCSLEDIAVLETPSNG